MNNITLTGRLTKDVELRQTTGENPTSVANITLAVDRRFRREGQPTADFLPVVVWGKNAEWLEKWCKKGTKVEVVGRLESRTYENKDGVKVYVVEVRAEEIGFAESKKASGDATDAPAEAPAPAEMPTPAADIDEGLPFDD